MCFDLVWLSPDYKSWGTIRSSDLTSCVLQAIKFRSLPLYWSKGLLPGYSLCSSDACGIDLKTTKDCEFIISTLISLNIIPFSLLIFFPLLLILFCLISVSSHYVPVGIVDARLQYISSTFFLCECWNHKPVTNSERQPLFLSKSHFLVLSNEFFFLYQILHFACTYF